MYQANELDRDRTEVNITGVTKRTFPRAKYIHIFDHPLSSDNEPAFRQLCEFVNSRDGGVESRDSRNYILVFLNLLNHPYRCYEIF